MARLSRLLDLDGTASVTAVLGPTNTGKTHRAIQRMLRHRSGIIGLPLRLLAREVYDRVRLERGEEAVALVTGEEKRIPPNPRYFVCTVEAMPLDRPVAFVAVDEVQLAADRARGHVFTDRILHARGLLETLFLGSDTVETLLTRLVPSIRVERQPRLSRLTWGGSTKLTSLPKRSAVVAFSVEGVYALADRLRAKHGGVAVVLGALSPRTRNAQVDLFQSGEVPYLVATDAIGMGLNLDLDHVAFSNLGKFDGRGHRALAPAEVAQIAGRAGRYRRDGTFGTLSSLGDLDEGLIRAVEGHTFPALQRLYWRNPDLDLSSVDALLAGLDRPPPHGFLLRMKDAEDHNTLTQLAGREEVRGRARGEERVGLLWEVAQVPDFRKTLTNSHADLLARVYGQLCDDGVLDEDWVARRVERLDRIDGDLDALTTRIAFVRTWRFLSHRRAWLRDAAHWQARTHALEDRLSDALHDELTRRFVDRRAMVLGRQGPRGAGTVTPEGVVEVAGSRVGVLEGLTFRPDREVTQDKGLLKAVRNAVRSMGADRVDAILAGDLDLTSRGEIRWQGAVLARLEVGPTLLSPRLRPRRHELVPAPDRERLSRHLEAWLQERLDHLLHPLREEDGLSPGVRAALHRLRSGLGDLPRDRLGPVSEEDRRALGRRSVRFGVDTVYALALLAPDRLALRATLHNVAHGTAHAPPRPGATSVPVSDPAFHAATGFRVLGPRAVRVDMAEKAAARVRRLTRDGPFAPPEELLSWLGCRREELPGILEALGAMPLADGRFGRRPKALPRNRYRPAEWQ